MGPLANAQNDSAELQARIEKAISKVVRFSDVRPNWRPGTDATSSHSPLYKYFDKAGSGFAMGIPPAALSDAFRLSVGVVVPGGGASLHDHTQEELMFVASGSFVIFFDEAQENKVCLNAWDAIMVPPNVPRGWRNVGQGVGCFLNISEAHDKMTPFSPSSTASESCGI
ncbi:MULTISPECIES: cupin domain-containing protein [Paraburkholderia]|uniref:cupin domain-containing protein n=1 Tax=Paraburkholderia TaxID=1822464 RepID=UPI002AB6EEE5|nr:MULTISPECIES: cupin domain-containing protein [Paraburkholderia]